MLATFDCNPPKRIQTYKSRNVDKSCDHLPTSLPTRKLSLNISFLVHGSRCELGFEAAVEKSGEPLLGTTDEAPPSIGAKFSIEIKRNNDFKISKNGGSRSYNTNICNSSGFQRSPNLPGCLTLIIRIVEAPLSVCAQHTGQCLTRVRF